MLRPTPHHCTSLPVLLLLSYYLNPSLTVRAQKTDEDFKFGLLHGGHTISRDPEFSRVGRTLDGGQNLRGLIQGHSSGGAEVIDGGRSGGSAEDIDGSNPPGSHSSAMTWVTTPSAAIWPCEKKLVGVGNIAFFIDLDAAGDLMEGNADSAVQIFGHSSLLANRIKRGRIIKFLTLKGGSCRVMKAVKFGDVPIGVGTGPQSDDLLKLLQEDDGPELTEGANSGVRSQSNGLREDVIDLTESLEGNDGPEFTGDTTSGAKSFW
eukprot:CAMPEP_0194301674 /NCGR_PEP_ID=MMETSP0169-20130528/61922_1 /TAXON_ID=218684 /ORGANISM="Corethron pennatum, Strain L29A3" /LENGTH=262 /DNA_ID=CAMNT_0039051939 /DNA_START=104 /DNA_END=889 /DNA_ORIENTATION=+